MDEIAALKRKEPVNLSSTQKRQLPKLPQQQPRFREDSVGEHSPDRTRTLFTSTETGLFVTSEVTSGNTWSDKTVGSHLVSSSTETTLSRSGTYVSRDDQPAVVLPGATLTSGTSVSFLPFSVAGTDVVLSSPLSGDVTTLISSTQSSMASRTTQSWDPSLLWTTTSMLGQQCSSLLGGYTTTWSTIAPTTTPLPLPPTQLDTGSSSGFTTSGGSLLPQLESVRQQFSLSTTSEGGAWPVIASSMNARSSLIYRLESNDRSQLVRTMDVNGAGARSVSNQGVVNSTDTVYVTCSTSAGHSVGTRAPMQAAEGYALGTQQLPPLTKFAGDGKEEDGEAFVDWLEQFEMVASLAKWNLQAKLVNLTTRLRGPALSFYRSCPTEQRANYHLLICLWSSCQRDLCQFRLRQFKVAFFMKENRRGVRLLMSTHKISDVSTRGLTPKHRGEVLQRRPWVSLCWLINLFQGYYLS